MKEKAKIEKCLFLMKLESESYGPEVYECYFAFSFSSQSARVTKFKVYLTILKDRLKCVFVTWNGIKMTKHMIHCRKS